MTNILTAHNLLIQRGGKPIFCLEELAIRDGEVLALIGPNGVGKSTLLLTLAQIIQPLSGDLIFCNKTLDLKKTLTYRRRIAIMLQDPLLLHSSVFDNVATGLRFRGIPKEQIEDRVMNWLNRLGINHLRDRSAQRLSGGEAQRVSMARSMVLNPEILFLDEPFRALDAPTRARLLADFRTLQTDVSMTTVMVTHDLDEALLLADRVAIILEGGLRQCDSPEKVFNSPSDADVADFVGVETILPGRVVSSKAGHTTVDVDGFLLEVIGETRVDQDVLFCLRPEDITLWVAKDLPLSSARNHLEGEVQSILPQGPLMRISVRCQRRKSKRSFDVNAFITRTSAQEMGIDVGKKIHLTFKASAAHCIPR
ncbi:MAG: ABC transporter ATP-binding protein [Chloroflexi bacterium]|nr:ABC transporter ATP-binding protein [Chloroflexota bacterium]